MKKILFICFIPALLFMACNKDRIEVEEVLAADEVLATKIQVLVERADTRYQSVDVALQESRMAFLLANDGLIDEYTANEREFMATDKRDGNLFLACLRATDPDQAQMREIRYALRMYQARNARIIESHRIQVRQLHQRMEEARKRLYDQLQAGEIDREQARVRLESLREAFMERLKHIRANHAEAFSRSYNHLLEKLKEVLTEEQWEAFAECLPE